MIPHHRFNQPNHMPPTAQSQPGMTWLAFALLTVVSWGVYGVFLHTGQLNMQDLPLAKAMSIAKTQYWDVLNLDRIAAISQATANEMFDTLYNGGEPGQWLQRLLNVLNARGRVYPDMAVDGRIGPLTVQALASFIARRGAEGETVLLKGLNAIQGARFITIAENNPSQEDFIYGWLRERA